MGSATRNHMIQSIEQLCDLIELAPETLALDIDSPFR